MNATSSQRAAQPRGLYLLFLTEMWERFSYYGMRALLVLFLVATTGNGGFGWSQESASRLYGWYTGLVYLTPLIGGWLADRFIGTHRSLLIGGAIIAAGHFSLALTGTNSAFFYAGLGLIIVGTGFFKPNVSTMVGQLYPPKDERRDAGFTIFYMGINLGALIGTLLCGYLGESAKWGWHYGFGAAGVGMVLGLVAYATLRARILGPLGMAAASAERVRHAPVPLTSLEKSRIAAIFIVAFFVIFFWAAFEQAGSSMNIFALENTRRLLFGMEIPASWFQSVNPAIILIGGPLMAALWPRLARMGREPSTPTKMALGLFFLAAGFVVLVFGALSTRGGQLASPLWLVAAYTLHTIGELCLSPVGLSLVTKLAPARFASLLMGTWFLANFFANLTGGYLAGAMAAIKSGSYFSVLGGAADFYLIFVVTSAMAGALLLALSPFLNRLMQANVGTDAPLDPAPIAAHGTLAPEALTVAK